LQGILRQIQSISVIPEMFTQ